MRRKVSVVHRICGVTQFVDEYIFHVPLDVDASTDEQTIQSLRRRNRLLTPGSRVRGDVAA